MMNVKESRSRIAPASPLRTQREVAEKIRRRLCCPGPTLSLPAENYNSILNPWTVI